MSEHFLTRLAELRNDHIEHLESMFGKRDGKFVMGGIARSSDRFARTSYPNGFYLKGGCTVDIMISPYPFDQCHYGQGGWQVAHECVHLLDPTLNGASSFLEEGLACWFQNDPTFHDREVRDYIEFNKGSTDTPPHPYYVEAEDLVREFILEKTPLTTAVCAIRNRGIRIGEIRPHMLACSRSTIQAPLKRS